MAYRATPRTEAKRDATRARLVEAAERLIASGGYGEASIARVAERAGVAVGTVYRHFPDEAALFDACNAHWAAANPPPDPGKWATIVDPDQRLLFALGELYAFYAQTELMLDNLFRDEPFVTLVQERFAAFHDYIEAARTTLMKGRNLRGTAHRRTHAAIGHALAFTTWKSLVREQHLTDTDAAILIRALILGAT